jgi:hypothetical protein
LKKSMVEGGWRIGPPILEDKKVGI